jgi:hypothetical protein
MPQERWDQISTWFRTCTPREHPRCHTSPPWLKLRYPTRLLDISQPGGVRLVDTDTLEENLRYATLSDICEDSSNSKLTASTASKLLDGVSDNYLSPIYRDAIATARKMDISYIWIDALCVIQDYPFDRESESSFLADVYAGSSLNISTTGSWTSSDGLFSPRTQRKVSFTLSVGTDMSYQPSQQPRFWVEIGLASTWEEKMEKYSVGKGKRVAGLHGSLC